LLGKFRPALLVAGAVAVVLCLAGCSAHGSSSAPVASSTVPTVARSGEPTRIALADVERILNGFDTTDTASFVGAIDVAAFLESVLGGLHPMGWGALCGPPPSAADQSRWVSEVVARYRQNVARVGAEAALDSRSPAQEGESPAHGDQLEVMTMYGLSFLGAMFGPSDRDSDWTWRVEGVSVTGTDTADVHYTAADLPSVMEARGVDHRWHFKDPSMVYTKHLQFSKGPDGAWRLAGWPNYAQFSEAVLGNIVPRPDLSVQDQWWSAL
jgi:hypothetical protein